MIYARSVMNALVKQGTQVQVTGYIKPPGEEIPELIFRIEREWRSLIRYNRLCTPWNYYRDMMPSMIDKYCYRVIWSEVDQEFIALCAEFPSLSWLDKSQEKALSGIRKLVTTCIKDLKSQKEEVPEPFSLRLFSGKFMVRVPPDTHRMLAIQAAESGVSLNRLVSSKLH